MIFESSPWKQQLLRDAGNLKRISKSPLGESNEDVLLTRLERLIFVGAYSMRKLHESGKLSTDWTKIKLSCTRFEFVGKCAPTILDAHKIDRFYELANPLDIRMPSDEFCDRVVHSFIFAPVVGEQGCVDGFHLTSDRLKKQCLWFVPLAEVITLMVRTGKDYPSDGVWIRTASGELKIWAGNGEPPAGWLASAKKLRR
ncbi:hypothetical protein ACVIW2_006121 [Bradyrhizobium huanghuaihaiense]|uniref:Uncharacterized protein n=1 Tax=Bradyrhizobium huanghuaihaiense TaxID=990078 RepID=A0A562RQP2_9BRAD|nr:hypothetical protein [Bradyrhizobium huanghuaihaiense]TWI70636.1 hypothetical protein IQ16_03809 [Bradyrhizobium huanghuaihaiense]